ncbi:RICIN domain-containing protein [Arenicella sp.]|nr:RICIN domain-containing protein [Arenicella sp.]
MGNKDICVFFKIGLLTLSLSSCSADRFGLAESGDSHEVSCKVVIDYDDVRTGVPISDELTEKQGVCSVGPPSEQLMTRACYEVVNNNFKNYASQYPDNEISFVGPISSTMIMREDDCPVNDFPFFDSSSSMLVDEYIVRDSIDDWTTADNDIDPFLGANIHINSTAEVSDSRVIVGAKFLAWRYANTTATGEINFDRLNCSYSGECDIVVRNIDLSIADFVIERPTIFARDITVKNTRLYTQGRYKTRVDRNGFFQIDNVSTIVASLIDDEQINLLNNRKISIYGQFNDARQGQSHTAATVKIYIYVNNGDYIIYTNSVLDISKFPSKLANGDGQDACLTGGPFDVSKNAVVFDCSFKIANQVWSFENRGANLRIRQAMTDRCLYVKPPIPTLDAPNPFSGFGGFNIPRISLPRNDYEGDVVSIVSCADDPRQLWSLGRSGEVKHVDSGKCLGVEENLYQPREDSVTVSDCNIKTNAAQRWFFSRSD